MSLYGQKVVAVIDTQSAFGVTIKQLKENVDTLQTSFSTLTGLAPGTLDTLQEIGAAIQALQTRATTLEAVSHPNSDNFSYSDTLSKVLNPLRSSSFLVGNNIQMIPHPVYALQVKQDFILSNAATLN